MRPASACSLLALIAGGTACGGGASADPGLGAFLRIEGAQFVPGELPDANGGPEVRSVRVPHNAVRIGTQRERISGTLAPEANAVAIGRDGDAGYWITTAAPPTVEEPELPAFRALLGLARDTPAGAFTLALRAVDRDGRFGARTSLQLNGTDTDVAAQSGSAAQLVVSLRWDSDADLDLHVLDPGGIELWARNINSLVPPAPGEAPADPAAWKDGGLLDFDSNAACALDGRDEENAYWQANAPHGRYQVRVVTASLCGQAVAHWSLSVQLQGEVIASARGTSVASDTRQQPGAGAGVAALEFAVP